MRLLKQVLPTICAACLLVPTAALPSNGYTVSLPGFHPEGTIFPPAGTPASSTDYVAIRYQSSTYPSVDELQLLVICASIVGCPGNIAEPSGGVFVNDGGIAPASVRVTQGCPFFGCGPGDLVNQSVIFSFSPALSFTQTTSTLAVLYPTGFLNSYPNFALQWRPFPSDGSFIGFNTESITPVPEPKTSIYFALGLALLAMSRCLHTHRVRGCNSADA